MTDGALRPEQTRSAGPETPRKAAGAGPATLGAIALGGVVGAEARYGLTQMIPAVPGSFPWAIVAINIAGGLFMGVLMALLARFPRAHPLTRPFIGVGILGGFTTFSTYSTDTFHLIDAGRPLVAGGYVTLTLAGALLAVVGGQALVTAFVSATPALASRLSGSSTSSSSSTLSGRSVPSTPSAPSGLPGETEPEGLP
ncbi:fluoride efflux transporter CrcB [Kineosporia sp. NBRC 101731]|uniref:fluoride efflux transporter CrcB n=1 Tax=Kineosporia sp. NBRC 101731 TaxID=3032199 RepID=UPI00249FA6AC|nr:fluoride efflux transporter CrcB [Kineosporia sp. NBRC 101731]GLY30167.1 hypothetical protein Kisp02_35320 [Kineosporia sp. NBRC 101731]